QRLLLRGRSLPGGEREAARRGAFDPIDGEDLVAGRPRQAAEHAAGFDFDGMNATDAGIDVEAGGVLPEPRDHPRGADQRDALVKADPAGPPGQFDAGGELPVRGEAELAVAAVVHPDATAVKPGRVRSRQPAAIDVARPSGEDHAPLV